jgi:hypothetical protein
VLGIASNERERRPRCHEPNTTHLGSNRHRMREISRSVQNDKQAKKCADCTVRTDLYGCVTWQTVRHMAGVLAVVWMSRCMTRGLFVVNGMATRGPINGRHVSPKHWLKLV